MNISNAKKEIKNTIKTYLKKDEKGEYLIPVIRQRPILLMGPPGIGKTQIMEQVSKECGVGLVSYTITHHTRQSAVGLPLIKEENFNGTPVSITEYTMSEIIASVYYRIKNFGETEGILFIDEINCVSETLTPAMLAFLQCKTFGNQKVPDGWIIVAAGNPPEYNKSVREFDMVTLDRVRLINIDVDLEVWKAYANKQNVHGSILSYLDIRPQNFYKVEADVEGISFVTARGWEDLSCLIKAYLGENIPITEEIVYEFLRNEDVANDFTAYFELYNKYKDDYRIDEILSGKAYTDVYERIFKASVDERTSVVNLLVEAINNKALSGLDVTKEIKNAYVFLEEALGETYQRELMLFTTDLTSRPEIAVNLALTPEEHYIKYSALYLGGGTRAALLKEI